MEYTPESQEYFKGFNFNATTEAERLANLLWLLAKQKSK